MLVSYLLHARPPDKFNAVYWKKVQVPKEAKADSSVTLDFFIPGDVKGFLLCDGNGDVIKTRILHTEGSHVSLFFNYKGSGEQWLIFMNDDIGHDENLQNASGLLHTVKRANGKIGNIDSPDSFMKTWASSDFEGATFEEKVFCGYNPFGNSENSMHLYEGKIKIGKTGNYRFYSASTDASFILIDGKTVVSWPGRHDPWKGANNEIFGDVNLTEGLHSFKYLNACAGSWVCNVAGILLPGEKKNNVLPKELFTDVFKATAGPLEGRDGKPVIEYTWDNKFMSFFDATCMHEVEFNAVVPSGIQARKITWDFGDGTSGEGNKVSHMYFRRLTYHTTMTAELAGGRQVKVKQDAQINYRFGQNENDDNQTFEMLKKSVQQESSSGIQPEGYDAIMTAMIFYKQKKEAEAFYRTSSLMKKAPANELLFDFIDKLVTAQCIDRENYKGAVEVWDAFLQKSQEPIKSRALLEKAGILVMPLGETQKCLDVLGEIRQASLSDAEKRLYLIAQADAVLRKEGLNPAYCILENIKTKSAPPKSLREKLERENSINAKLFLLEQRVASGKFQDALDVASDLELEKPSIRFYAPLALMKGRAYAKMGKNTMAGTILENALLLDMDDDTDAKTRLSLAGVYVARKEYLKAKQQIAAIKKRSPGSLEEIEANKLLDKINEGAK